MKIGVVLLGFVGLLAVSGVACAQTPPPRTGFQMALRTGYAIPMGNAVKDGKMSDLVSGQVPIIVDVGGKIIPELFLGGYFGLAFGGVSGVTEAGCQATNNSCISVDLTLGIEAQYHILPGGSANPWLGYGLGLESMAVSEANGSSTDSYGLGGFNFARLSGGVDFRVNRTFGVGPFVEYSIGKFTSASVGNRDIDLKGFTATHEWLTLGARFVFFP